MTIRMPGSARDEAKRRRGELREALGEALHEVEVLLQRLPTFSEKQQALVRHAETVFWAQKALDEADRLERPF